MLAQETSSSPPATQVTLVRAPLASPDLCSPSAVLTVGSGQLLAVVVPRGNCSFQAKALAAQRLGFAAAIVINTIAADYAAVMPNLTLSTSVVDLNVDECDADCDAGSGWISPDSISLEQALLGDSCPAQASGFSCPGSAASTPSCVLTGSNRGEGAAMQIQSCCVSDHNLIMGASIDTTMQLPTIPVYSATINGGERLLAAAVANTAGVSIDQLSSGLGLTVADASSVTLGLRWVPSIDPSSVITWLVGFGALLGASWYGAGEERSRLLERSGSAPRRDPSALTMEAVPLSMRDTALMLLGAAVMLSVLFLLIQLGVGIVYIVIGLYCVGGTSALAMLLFYPCWNRVRGLRSLACDIRFLGDTTGPGVAATLSAAACMLIWVVFRHEPWSWVVQDAVGAAMCLLFCRQLAIPSVRVAAAMGACFLVYDVVMVFITPLIVGSSVMIDVATAGAPVAVFDEACYCRLHPDDWSVCGPGERMPILFAVPRMLDYRGGYSLLGLGDIVIPGLIVTLALRLDLALHGSCCGGYYWAASIVGYAIGLASAQVAASVTKSGQPALLYIIPFVTVAVMLVARWRGEFVRVWLYGTESQSSMEARRQRRRRRSNADDDGDDGGRGAMLTHGAEDQNDTSVMAGLYEAASGRPDDITLVSGAHGGEGVFLGVDGAGVLGGGDDEEGATAIPLGGDTTTGSRIVVTVDDDLAAGDLGSGTGQIWGSSRGAATAAGVELSCIEMGEATPDGAVGKGGAHDELL